MARVNRGGSNFDSLVQAFTGIARETATAQGRVAQSSDYLQGRALSSLDDYNRIFGTPEEFLQRYAAFDREYQAALGEQLDHFKTNRVVAAMSQKRQIMDFNFLMRDAQDKLSGMFKSDVMRLNNLFADQAGGLPGIEIPSSNKFRAMFRYEVDNSQGIIHPAQIFLNRMNFNFNPEKSGLESISTGQQMMSHQALRQQWENYSSTVGTGAERLARQVDPFQSVQEGQKVLTVDIESSIIGPNSQVRSFSAAEMTLENGVFTAPKTVTNVGFDADQLNGINVRSLNGGIQDLNSFIANLEGTRHMDMGMGGEKFLDEFVKLTDKMLDADRVAGHNIRFDLDMLARTAMGQEGFSSYKTAGGTTAAEALDSLNEKIAGGNYVVDTLDSTRTFLSNQAQQLLDQSIPAGDARSAAFIKNLLSEEVMTNVKLGGSVKYAGVGEFLMGTNLFELLEKDSPDKARDLFGMITRGSHIAETDVHLQSYIGKYLHEKTVSGELKLLQLVDKDKEVSQFGNFARMRLLRSSAITPTTNIADVGHIFDTAFDYMMTDDRGIAGVSMRATVGQMQAEVGLINPIEELIGQERYNNILNTPTLDVNDVTGTLKHSEKKGFVFATAQGEFELADQDKAKSFIRTKLMEARAGEQQSTLQVGRGVETLMRNVANDSFIDLGFNYLTNSQTEDLVSIGRAVSSRPVVAPTISDITSALGDTYETYGTGFSVNDHLRRIFRSGVEPNVFSSGLKKMTPDESAVAAQSVAQKFQAIGDPYAKFVDPRSRILSGIMAEATTNVGLEIGTSARNAGVSAEAISHLSYGKTFSELGVSHFRAQDSMRIFNLAAEDSLVSSRILAMPEVIQSIIDSAASGTALSGAKINVGLSKTVPKSGGMRINAVWQVGEEFGKEGSRQLAEGLFDSLVQGPEEFAKLLRVDHSTLSDKIKAEIVQAQQLNNTGARATAIDNLTSLIESQGVGVAYVDGKDAVRLEKGISDLGHVLDNEKLNDSIRMYQETIDYGMEEGMKIGERGMAFGPVYNPQSIAQAGLEDEFRAAREIIPGETVSPAVSAQRRLATTIEAEGARDLVQSTVSRKLRGLGDNAMRTFYMTNKKRIGYGALGVAAVTAGYYMFKKHRETNLYDETLAQQPYEKPRSVNLMNDSARGATARDPIMSDPLATTGVVSGLDRQKIGHTRMGNNKYNHLYGG